MQKLVTLHSFITHNLAHVAFTVCLEIWDDWKFCNFEPIYRNVTLFQFTSPQIFNAPIQIVFRFA